MNKSFCLILVAVILILASALPSQADGWGGHGGHGGVSFRGSVWVGPGWWGPWGYPYYYDPYYAEPPVVIEKHAPVYVQPNRQQEASDYWYFCTKPQGYYPYIKRCPSGWLKVVPSAPTEHETNNDIESSQHDSHEKNSPSPSPSRERY